MKFDVEISKDLEQFYADPLGHVMYSYPWDTDSSIQVCKLVGEWAERYPNIEYGPDIWACEFLDQLGDEIAGRGFDGKTSVRPIRFATVSGHGIGKSVMTAWLIKFIMDTRAHAKGTVTAVTADQLKTKTWAELGKWNDMSVTKHWFNYSTSRGNMCLEHKQFPQRWRCDAQTCKEENSEAFAGQHSVTATSFYIFDEASGIPEKIYEVRTGGMTDGEPMCFDFGNPTRNSGTFYEECMGKLRKRFIVRMIDSRDVSITNKETFQEMIEDYGEDSDIVKVRVKGQFPSASSAQFISGDDVRDCQNRELMNNERLPMILGVDVARQGNDESVIYPRQGNDARSFPVGRFSGIDGIHLAEHIIERFNEYTAQGYDVHIFIDAGGGYGGSPLDYLRHLGYAPLDVFPGRKAYKEEMYRYRSDELWGDMKDALKGALCLPPLNSKTGAELRGQLTQREFGFTASGQKISLEPKKKMKDRGLKSPDIADALALTYAEEVAPRLTITGAPMRQHSINSDYDPIEAGMKEFG